MQDLISSDLKLQAKPCVILERITEEEIKLYTAPRSRLQRRKKTEASRNLRDVERVDFSLFEQYKRTRKNFLKKKEKKKKKGKSKVPPAEDGVCGNADAVPDLNPKTKKKRKRKKQSEKDGSTNEVKKKNRRIIFEGDSDSNHGVSYEYENTTPQQINGYDTCFSFLNYAPTVDHLQPTTLNCSNTVLLPLDCGVDDDAIFLSSLTRAPKDVFDSELPIEENAITDDDTGIYPKLNSFFDLFPETNTNSLSSSRTSDSLSADKNLSAIKSSLFEEVKDKYIDIFVKPPLENDDVVGGILKAMDSNFTQSKKVAPPAEKNVPVSTQLPSKDSSNILAVKATVISSPANIASKASVQSKPNFSDRQKQLPIEQKSIESDIEIEVQALMESLVRKICGRCRRLCPNKIEPILCKKSKCSICQVLYISKNNQSMCDECKTIATSDHASMPKSMGEQSDQNMKKTISVTSNRKRVKTALSGNFRHPARSPLKSTILLPFPLKHMAKTSPLKYKRTSFPASPKKIIKKNILKNFAVNERHRLLYRIKQSKEHVKQKASLKKTKEEEPENMSFDVNLTADNTHVTKGIVSFSVNDKKCGKGTYSETSNDKVEGDAKSHEANTSSSDKNNLSYKNVNKGLYLMEVLDPDQDIDLSPENCPVKKHIEKNTPPPNKKNELVSKPVLKAVTKLLADTIASVGSAKGSEKAKEESQLTLKPVTHLPSNSLNNSSSIVSYLPEVSPTVTVRSIEEKKETDCDKIQMNANPAQNDKIACFLSNSGSLTISQTPLLITGISKDSAQSTGMTILPASNSITLIPVSTAVSDSNQILPAATTLTIVPSVSTETRIQLPSQTTEFSPSLASTHAESETVVEANDVFLSAEETQQVLAENDALLGSTPDGNLHIDENSAVNKPDPIKEQGQQSSAKKPLKTSYSKWDSFKLEENKSHRQMVTRELEAVTILSILDIGCDFKTAQQHLNYLLKNEYATFRNLKSTDVSNLPDGSAEKLQNRVEASCNRIKCLLFAESLWKCYGSLEKVMEAVLREPVSRAVTIADREFEKKKNDKNFESWIPNNGIAIIAKLEHAKKKSDCMFSKNSSAETNSSFPSSAEQNKTASHSSSASAEPFIQATFYEEEIETEINPKVETSNSCMYNQNTISGSATSGQVSNFNSALVPVSNVTYVLNPNVQPSQSLLTLQNVSTPMLSSSGNMNSGGLAQMNNLGGQSALAVALRSSPRTSNQFDSSFNNGSVPRISPAAMQSPSPRTFTHFDPNVHNNASRVSPAMLQSPVSQGMNQVDSNIRMTPEMVNASRRNSRNSTSSVELPAPLMSPADVKKEKIQNSPSPCANANNALIPYFPPTSVPTPPHSQPSQSLQYSVLGNGNMNYQNSMMAQSNNQMASLRQLLPVLLNQHSGSQMRTNSSDRGPPPNRVVPFGNVIPTMMNTNRTMPASISLQLQGANPNINRTVPTNASLPMQNSNMRTMPTNISLQASNSNRTIPGSISLYLQSSNSSVNRTIPASISVQQQGPNRNLNINRTLPGNISVQLQNPNQGNANFSGQVPVTNSLVLANQPVNIQQFVLTGRTNNTQMSSQNSFASPYSNNTNSYNPPETAVVQQQPPVNSENVLFNMLSQPQPNVYSSASSINRNAPPTYSASLQAVQSNSSQRGNQILSSENNLMYCAVCSKPATMRCKQCTKVVYCNAACARLYWHEKHKMECSSTC